MRGKPSPALAARIRELKDRRDLSYRELGAAVGVTKTTAMRYANGTIHVPADRLALIARAFGCDVRCLFMVPGSPLPKARKRQRSQRRWRSIAGNQAVKFGRPGEAPSDVEVGAGTRR